MYLEVTRRPIEDGFYEALLRSVAPYASTVGMIVRSGHVRLKPRAAYLIRALSSFLVSVDEVEEWPGTKLVGDRRSLRYLYQLNSSSLEILLDASEGIFEWVNPELPEDIHFLRPDGSTVLGSIAQEDAAWLEGGDDDVQNMLNELPKDIRQSLRALRGS